MENYSVGEQAMQLLPSGPGYLTIPNLRLFTAGTSISAPSLLTSPYFVPDDSLLEAITTVVSVASRSSSSSPSWPTSSSCSTPSRPTTKNC